MGGKAFRLGRLFGIELRIDPSWIFIFGLIGWSLTSLFSSWHPDWFLGTSIVVALLAALVFFASVLLHELAHSLVARAYGIPVRDITLHLFGGVSNIEKEPPTPGAEFLIAIVGPIASIGLGAAMMFGSAFLIDLHFAQSGSVPADVDNAASLLARLGPVTTLLMWLGPVNISVGVFNLIPGFPLDGGRMLRAALWKITGRLHDSTRMASSVGRFIGWIFIGLGGLMVFGVRVPFFGQGLTSGLWLAMIGLFLRNAATQHRRSADIEAALDGVRVIDLMRTIGPVVTIDTPVHNLSEWFMRRDEPIFPVVDRHGAFRGLVSLDVVRGAVGNGHIAWRTARVGELMIPASRIVTTNANESITEALRKLATSEEIVQLPVLDGQMLMGMLYEKDIMRWLDPQAENQRQRVIQQPQRQRPA